MKGEEDGYGIFGGNVFLSGNGIVLALDQYQQLHQSHQQIHHRCLQFYLYHKRHHPILHMME